MKQQKPEKILNSAMLGEIRRGYQILFVMGFLSDPIVELGGRYFDDQMAWLKSKGIDCFRLDKGNSSFRSENLSQENAEVLKRTIDILHSIHPDKGILIISHSKGGLDALAAFFRYPVLVGKKVVGWIPLQTPFQGTLLADWVTSDDESGMASVVSGALMEEGFGGNPAVIRSMRTDVRGEAMKRKAEAIHKLSTSISILAFASWIERDLTPGKWSALLGTRDLMKELAGLDNDGVVPVNGAVLRANDRAASPFIKVVGIDHALPVMNAIPGYNGDPPGFAKLDRILFTSVLLRLWLDIHSKNSK
jgi:hypothetical protein